MKSHTILTVCMTASMIVLFAPTVAFAHYPYSQQECEQYSQIVYLATKAKENGAAPLAIKAATISTIKQLMFKSFIKDETDATVVLKSVGLVLSSNMDAKTMMTIAYNSCVKELMKTESV